MMYKIEAEYRYLYNITAPNVWSVLYFKNPAYLRSTFYYLFLYFLFAVN